MTDSTSIVIFGASGDLSHRKLIPALYHLYLKGRLPKSFRVFGIAGRPWTDEDLRRVSRDGLNQFSRLPVGENSWGTFSQTLSYLSGDISRAETYHQINERLSLLEGGEANRMYYLATPPEYFLEIINNLAANGLLQEDDAWRRVVIEKPFGEDLESARSLNQSIHAVMKEKQVYRIDHYLGKETVQNILVARFANAIFEPVWNRNYVDYVEITAAEEVAVGHRGSYYDTAGVLRDMFQNHLLQQLALTAMEAPARFEAEYVRDEKVKVLRAIRPMRPEDVAANTVRGQYQGYREEPGVAAESRTSTFAAVKLLVDNWRWQGVPFYLRSGKAMSCQTTQIVIQFRQPPHLLFEGGPRGVREANRLVIQIQPAEGIQLHFQTKVPDAGMQMRLTDLSFRFQERFSGVMPDAYQRLLLDVMLGDASLFARADEVELAWGIIDPIQSTWDQQDVPELYAYERGGWGPEESAEWMYYQGRQWFDTCPVLH